MPAVPTTTAMVKIQRNNRSRTIATYFQSSFACGKNMWRIVSLWFLCQNCEVGGEVYSDWPNLQQAPTVGAKDAQYYYFCADPNFKKIQILKIPQISQIHNFKNTKFQKPSEQVFSFFLAPGPHRGLWCQWSQTNIAELSIFFTLQRQKLRKKLFCQHFCIHFPAALNWANLKIKAQPDQRPIFTFLNFSFIFYFFILNWMSRF